MSTIQHGQTRRLGDLKPHPRNPRIHSPAQIKQIAAAMKEWDWTVPILIDEADQIIAGHGRQQAGIMIYGADYSVPVTVAAGWPEDKKLAYVIADNRLTEIGEWDRDILEAQLEELDVAGFDIELTGFSLDEFAPEPPADPKGKLSDQFMIPPFSVLNAREGWWQERKAQWLALGIRSEVGRGDNLTGMSLVSRLAMMISGHVSKTMAFIEECRAKGMDDAAIEAEAMKRFGPPKGGKAKTFNSNERMAALQATGDSRTEAHHTSGGRKGRKASAIPGGGAGKSSAWLQKGDKGYESNSPINNGSVAAGLTFGTIPNYDGGDRSLSGTSIFDPVLCEIAYRWFSPTGGLVLDPFAGGSVRGIVAAKLGRDYVGVDLRHEQIEANEQQRAQICAKDDKQPRWITGDSRNIDTLAAGVEADLIFSCPPYADLEVYSEDPADLSNMDYREFDAAYREIILKATSLLKPDRFAVFVVGEVRGKDGNYYGFVPDTIKAFREAGLHFYNEAILLTAIGSLPIRAGKQFAASRKLGKTHQNVLIFAKGNARKAAAACGRVEIGDLPEPDEGEA